MVVVVLDGVMWCDMVCGTMRLLFALVPQYGRGRRVKVRVMVVVLDGVICRVE